MQANLATEGAIDPGVGIAVAVAMVHLVAAVAGEEDTSAAGMAVDLTLECTDSEFTVAVCVEPDVSKPEDVD